MVAGPRLQVDEAAVRRYLTIEDGGRSGLDLAPREKDKLLVAVAGMVARRRLERGVRLKHPEALRLGRDDPAVREG